MRAKVRSRCVVRCLTVCLMLAFAVTSSVCAQDHYRFLKEWGSQGTGNGEFDQPLDLAIDSQGRVYVVDSLNHRIQKFGPDGTFVRAWGSHGGDPGQFSVPSGIALTASGRVYVADRGYKRIQKFTSEGGFIDQIRFSPDGHYYFSIPQGVAVGPGGRIYVADTGNDRIQKFSSTGDFIASWGSQGSGIGQFDGPIGIAVAPDGRIYVGDEDNHRTQVFASDGAYLGQWVTWSAGRVPGPTGVAVDAAGDVYVAGDAGLRKFSASGELITTIGEPGSGPGQWRHAHGVAVHPDGRVYCADASRHCILVFEPSDAAPDMMVRHTLGTKWKFNNVYGSSSTQKLTWENPATARFALRLQNDSESPQDYQIFAKDLGSGWTIRYYTGFSPSEDRDITDQITRGDGHWVEGLKPNKSEYFYVVVKPPPLGALPGTFARVVVEATCPDDGASDAVRIVVTAPEIYQPDVRIKIPRQASWTGDDEYLPDHTDQLARQTVPSEKKAFYHVSIQNDGNVADSFRVTGPRSSLHWRVRYFDHKTGNSLTDAMKGGGWRTPSLKPDKAVRIRVEVTPRELTSAGDKLIAKIKAVSTGDSTKADRVKAITHVKTGLSAAFQLAALAATTTNAGAQVSFALSSDASVTATVLNLAGRPVKTIIANRPLAAGTRTLLWSGRSDSGLMAPPGRYLVRVTARDEGGGEATALAPLTVD